MRSQYDSRRIRWILAPAVLAYGLATGVAPAVHLAEDGREMHAWAAAVQAGEPAPQGPPIPPSGVHDELDCPMCLMIVQAAHPGTMAADQPNPAGSAHEALHAAHVAGVEPLSHPDARAPPSA